MVAHLGNGNQVLGLDSKSADAWVKAAVLGWDWEAQPPSPILCTKHRPNSLRFLNVSCSNWLAHHHQNSKLPIISYQ